MGLNRSFLSVPGDRGHDIELALAAGADAVILDLEATVPPHRKAAARKIVAERLSRPRACRTYVRLDGPNWERDLEALAGAGFDGVLVPKAESPELLAQIDVMLTGLEEAAGAAAGSLDLMPLVETAAGIANGDGFAVAARRVRRLAFGAGDWCREQGIRRTSGETELAEARAALVSAARRGGMEAPVDTPFIHGLPDFRRAAELSRDLGFQGRICIATDQVSIANAVYASGDL